jgi:predicted DNA-binding transcriptional regulator YafY
MQKLDRLFEIVLILQNSKKSITAQELSERLDVNIRTVYRYIQTLGYAGIPIESTTGMGYRVMDDYHLPPIMLTPKEAAALLMGSEFVMKKVDYSYKKEAKSAFLKIKSVLKKDTLEYVNKIDESTIVINDQFADKSIIAKIQDSIAERKLIKLKYNSMSKNEVTERTIEPMGLIYYSENWRIIAYCRLREDFREFRLNRINNLKCTGITFDRRIFSLNDFAGRVYNIANPLEIKIWFDKKAARLVKEKYSQGLMNEIEQKNGSEMTFLISGERIDLTLNWILSFHKSARLLGPEVIKKNLIRKIEEISKLYS